VTHIKIPNGLRYQKVTAVYGNGTKLMKSNYRVWEAHYIGGVAPKSNRRSKIRSWN